MYSPRAFSLSEARTADDRRCDRSPSSSAEASSGSVRKPRTKAIRPVRASSRMPYGRTASMKASIFFSWPEISTIIWSAPTSTIRPRKIWTSPCSSSRCEGGASTLISIRSRLDEVGPGKMSRTPVDRDDLLELLADLLEQAIVAVDDDGDPREVRVLGLADRETLDVEDPVTRTSPRRAPGLPAGSGPGPRAHGGFDSRNLLTSTPSRRPPRLENSPASPSRPPGRSIDRQAVVVAFRRPVDKEPGDEGSEGRGTSFGPSRRLTQPEWSLPMASTRLNRRAADRRTGRTGRD